MKLLLVAAAPCGVVALVACGGSRWLVESSESILVRRPSLFFLRHAVNVHGRALLTIALHSEGEY